MKKLFFVFLLLPFYSFAQPCADEDTVRANAVTLITANSVRVNGTTSHFAGTVLSIQLRYVRVGQTDTATASAAGTNALRNLSGLQANTQYIYYYKSICGSGTNSQTIGVYFFTTLSATVVYATERSTVFPGYLKADSGFTIPRLDTGSLYRAQDIGGNLRFRPADSLPYYYNGDIWKLLAVDSAGIMPALNRKVDSVTVAGDSLWYWINGVSYGYILPGTTTEWSLTGNSGTVAGTNFIGTTDSVSLMFKTNSGKRLTINPVGAIGLGTGEDYGTSGYLLSTNGSSTAPTWVNPASYLTNIYNSDGTLTGSRTVSGGTLYGITFDNITNYTVESDGGVSIGAITGGGLSKLYSNYGTGESGVYANSLQVKLEATSTSFGTHGSSIINYADSIVSSPYNGNYYVKDLTSAVGTNGLRYDPSTDKITYTDAPSGSGTPNFIPKWTPNGTTLGNSGLSDDGTTITSTENIALTNKKITFNPAAGASEVMRISNPTSFSGATPYQTYIYDVANGDGTYNQPVVSGFNQYGTFNPAVKGIYHSTEPKYLTNFMEDHLEVYMPTSARWPSGETSRLSSATFIAGDTMGNSSNTWDFRGNSFAIKTLKSHQYASIGGDSTGVWQAQFYGSTGISGIKFAGVSGIAESVITSVPVNQNLLYSSWNNIYFDGTNTANTLSWTKSTNTLAKVRVSNTLVKNRVGATDSIMFEYTTGTGDYKAGLISNYGTGEIQHYVSTGGYFNNFYHNGSQAFRTITGGIAGGSSANEDLTIQGTNHATKTTSYVNIQPSGGLVGVGTTTPTSTLHTTSFATAYRAITALRTLDATDHTIEVTANTFTVTLPTAVGITGRIYVITNSGSGTITIGTTSSQTFVNINAAPTTLTLGAVGASAITSYTVVSNGANWIVTSKVKNE